MRAVPVQLRDSTSWRQRAVLACRRPRTATASSATGATAAPHASGSPRSRSPRSRASGSPRSRAPGTNGPFADTGAGRLVDAVRVAFRPDPPPPASVLGRLAVDRGRGRQRDAEHRPSLIHSPGRYRARKVAIPSPDSRSSADRRPAIAISNCWAVPSTLGPDPVDHVVSVARSVSPSIRFFDPNTA